VKLATVYRLWLGAFPALVAVAVVGAILTERSNHESDRVTMAIVLPVIGLVFVLAGLIARTLRPDNATGLLLVLTGFLWMVQSFFEADSRWVLGVAALFGSLFLGAFVHLMVAYPEGRLGSTLERRLVVGLWTIAFVAGALPAVFERKFDDCKGCPDNPFLVADHDQLAGILRGIFTVLGLLIFLGVIAVLVRRWHRATPAQRTILGPVYLSGGVSLVLVTALFIVGSFSNSVGDVLGPIAYIAFGTVPIFFLAGLLRTRLYRAGQRLLQVVPDEPSMEEIQTGFRSVLGDPTLEYLTWLEETGGYVDIRGNPRALPADTRRRATTRIDSETAEPLAAFVHDAALRHQQALLDEVVSTARIAIQKDRGREDLRRSEERSRALLGAIPDLMFRIARDGTYIEAKGRRESLVRPAEEIVGRTVNELLPPDVAELFVHALAQPPSAGVQSIDYRLTINGEERWFEGRLVPSGDDEMVVIVRDFTDRRRLEDELERRFETVQREQAFTRAVVNIAPVVVMLVDPDGRIVRFNDHTERVFGVTDDESVRGRFWWDVFLPEEGRAGGQAYRAWMNDGADELIAESEWQTANGDRRVIRATVMRVYDGDGSLRFLICGQDLTELVQQRAEVERQRDFLSAVGRATPSLLVIVDHEGVVTKEGVNYAFRELTGYNDEDAIGKTFWDLVAPPELVGEVKDAFEAQVAAGVGIEHESAWIGSSGQWRIVAWWLRPLGQEDKYVVCGVDVTERKAQEAELRASRSRIVEATDNARRKLERNLHDGAQQRLVSLSLALRLAQARLRDDPDGADQILAGAGEELTQALAELRELARGIHPAVLTDRGLPAALEALAARAPLPVELSTSLEEPLPQPVEAAAYYVVSEALANVAKYAEASAVQVRAERQNGRVLVEVADDGIGGADPAAGSGLRGLADRVEALDGHLEVESVAGSGTRVRAVIPLHAS